MKLCFATLSVFLAGCDEKALHAPSSETVNQVNIGPRAGRLVASSDGSASGSTSSQSQLAPDSSKIKSALEKVVEAGEDISSACTGGEDECPGPDVTVEKLTLWFENIAKMDSGKKVVDIFVAEAPKIAGDQENGRRLVDEVLELIEVVGSHDLSEARNELLLKQALEISKHFKTHKDAPSSQFLKGMNENADDTVIPMIEVARIMDLQLDKRTSEAFAKVGGILKKMEKFTKEQKADWPIYLESVRKEILLGHAAGSSDQLSASTESLDALSNLIKKSSK